MDKTTCAVPECSRDTYYPAAIYCSKHFQRLQRTGSATGSAKKAVEQRFWAQVDKSGDCWLWTASGTRNGYGTFSTGGGIRKLSHRYSYEMANGPIADGMQIDHICFNKACVRPSHLREVTNKQNHENRARPRKDNTSGVTGVHWSKSACRWVAVVCHNGTRVHVGAYRDLEDAERAVIAKRVELFTHNELDRKAVA